MKQACFGIRVLLALGGVLALAGVPAAAQLLVGRTQGPPSLAGEWLLEQNEDPGAVGGLQPNPADYLGVPFNEAGRMRSDTTAESIWGTPEYQCRPHSAPHQWRGLGGARILEELDPLTRGINAYHVQFWRSLDRPIYMDRRPHPPAWAPHSWTGFSTGEWVGNTLVVQTTHLKDGFLKRGGPQTSDMLTMTEFITRHDDILTVVTVTDDPIYMDEPYVQSTTYLYDPTSRVNTESCNAGAFAESGGSDPHFVPHLLPGEAESMLSWLEVEDWVPLEPVRGGVRTIYPEYRSTLDGSVDVRDLDVPSSPSAFRPDEKIAAQGPRDGRVHVLPVQGNIYMLVVDGTNLTASVGREGVLLVNTGPAAMSGQVLETLNALSVQVAGGPRPNDCFGLHCPQAPAGFTSPQMNAIISSPAPPRPLRYIINTSGAAHHTSGNGALAAAGAGRGGTAAVVAHENVLLSMAGDETVPSGAWPTETFFGDIFKMTSYFNGEAVVAYHAPRANSDGDSIVFFRHSEVISAGDIFSTISYPKIDLERGGSVQGVIDGLNDILDLAVAEYRSQGGTWVIPSRGRLSDTADVASYRNMVTIIRDRVQNLIDQGMTVAEVQAARPTLDFDGRYGAVDDEWTAEMFVEAVYRSLTNG